MRSLVDTTFAKLLSAETR